MSIRLLFFVIQRRKYRKIWLLLEEQRFGATLPHVVHYQTEGLHNTIATRVTDGRTVHTHTQVSGNFSLGVVVVVVVVVVGEKEEGRQVKEEEELVKDGENERI